jgi:hypothetical protein
MAAKSLSLPGMLRDIIQRDGWRVEWMLSGIGCYASDGTSLYG